jgi:murein L,D-transpeptidase YcbB/YkuD
LGILDTLKENISDSILKQKITIAQNLFNQQEEPKISDRLRAELNIDIFKRIKRLKVSLNYYKWLYWKLMNSNEPVILVNIPNANMKVYKKNTIILEMKMVLGKYSTKTPTLTSKVNNVILYPYWHVPYSIATKELLPKIKRNISYLNSGNYQVINSSGNIVNPYSINWQSLSKYYFPYTIRQSTGCDNSLGLIKLNFENPFGVYLHDTPSKLYFKQNKRFYSHGCMRMENPTDISKIILGSNHIAIDTLIDKGCLINKSPIWVNAEIKTPVIVWYNLTGIDKFGKVVFYEDIYKNENK